MVKSIACDEFGDASVLHERDVVVAQPGPGQLRIAVRAAGVNGLDAKIRAGLMKDAFPVEFPFVPGIEASGVVDAVGAGVEDVQVGDEVFGPTISGSYAAMALMEAAKATPKPAAVEWTEAAALPVAAETAYRSLELLGVQAGETLLIHGAAGAVGSVAVQIAVARGVKVLGTASERNHDYLCSRGATPIAYGDGLVERVRAAAPDGIDAALDLAGREEAVEASVQLTGGTQRVLEIAGPAPAQQSGVRFSAGGPDENRTPESAREVLMLIAADKLRLRIDRVVPLQEAGDAQRAVEQGHTNGKIVLSI